MIHEEGLFLGQRSVNVAVWADKRADPDHDLEAEGMKFVNHRLGIAETAGMERPLAIIFLPVVVDHQHAGGKPLSTMAWQYFSTSSWFWSYISSIQVLYCGAAKSAASGSFPSGGKKVFAA